MFAVGMTTAPRPSRTVIKSLNSLRVDAGYGGIVHMFDDGCGEIFVGDKIVHHTNSPPLGPLVNFVSALSNLIRESYPYILLMEDDVMFASGAFEQLQRDLPEIHERYGRQFLYSIYTSQTVSFPLEKHHKATILMDGTYTMNWARKAGGSQAYVFTQMAAVNLLSEGGFKERIRQAINMPFDPLRKKENRNCDRDNQVSAALMRLSIPVVYRIPSLVHHSLGSENSSYWKKGAQDTRYFSQVAGKLGKVAR